MFTSTLNVALVSITLTVAHITIKALRKGPLTYRNSHKGTCMIVIERGHSRMFFEPSLGPSVPLASAGQL